MPGFMNIDFMNQIRKEEKIGGGGTAIIYKGVILDPKLKEVIFLFFFFGKKINFKKKKKKKFGFEEVAIKQILEDQRYSVEEKKLKFEQEIAIIWGTLYIPNVIKLVGYSENPRCIITKVFSFFLFLWIL